MNLDDENEKGLSYVKTLFWSNGVFLAVDGVMLTVVATFFGTGRENDNEDTSENLIIAYIVMKLVSIFLRILSIAAFRFNKLYGFRLSLISHYIIIPSILIYFIVEITMFFVSEVNRIDFSKNLYIGLLMVTIEGFIQLSTVLLLSIVLTGYIVIYLFILRVQY